MGKFHPSRRAYATPTNISTDITNMPLAGGNKLQGLPPKIDIPSNINKLYYQSRTYNEPDKRTEIVCNNQLGGIGKLRSQFVPTADGINGCPDLFDEYNFTLFDQFTNGSFNPILITNLLNAGIESSGTGIFPSNVNNDPYSSDYYVNFNLNGNVESRFKPIQESIDLKYYDYSTYRPRSINLNTFKSMCNNHNVTQQEIAEITINSITISFIAGSPGNLGDTPDVDTNLGFGRLTWPENLYFELIDIFGDSAVLIPIFETKLPIIPTPPAFTNLYKWYMEGSFISNTAPCGGQEVPTRGGKHANNNVARAIPAPVGTPFVSSQSNTIDNIPSFTNYFSSLPHYLAHVPSNIPCAGTKAADIDHIIIDNLIDSNNNLYGTLKSSQLQTNGKNELYARISELGLNGTGQYFRQLIQYTGPNGDATKYTEVTIPINISFKVNDNNELPDINELTRGRIFQDRYTGTADNYGIRYISLDLSYKTYRRGTRPARFRARSS